MKVGAQRNAPKSASFEKQSDKGNNVEVKFEKGTSAGGIDLFSERTKGIKYICLWNGDNFVSWPNGVYSS